VRARSGRAGRGTAVAAFLVLLAAGCATSHKAARPDGGAEIEISCWYLGWYHCYDRARESCPDGYRVVSETEGWGGRKLRIACTAGK
jgi:hypothetical protein